jgi:hypothetical protein
MCPRTILFYFPLGSTWFKRASAAALAACGCLLAAATTGGTPMDAAPAGRGRRTECSYTLPAEIATRRP